MPLVRGAAVADQGTPLFWEHSGNAAVRDGRWKLVRQYASPWELYDLESDPTELVDVVDEFPETAQGLFEAWVAWAARVGVRDFERIVDLYELRGLNASDAAG